ncbi:MAG: murein biosynthesis integral membrane protein MurJ [Anaerolineaceae bacterium]|nr:murein biosynthesis integral membrane protein MurJ [Anaerolineaceae bacterium]
MSEATASTANRQIVRAAGTVMIAFVVSKLVSLGYNLLAADAFGTSSQMDAFLAANRVSDIIFNLVAGGALASAFVPMFVTLLTQEKREDAWRLASGVTNLVLLALMLISLLVGIFAPWVVTRLLAAGFKDPEQIALTVRLLRIQMPAAVIFGLSGLIMGVLNAHQSFLFPALAPSMYPIGLIAGGFFLVPSMGIDGLAWGVLGGALLHLLVQIPALLRLPGRRYTPTLGLHIPDVRQVFLLMGPRLLGVGVVNLNFWINTLIASYLQPGSLAAVNWGFILMLMPQAALAQSVATAAMPTFSAQVARGKPEEMRASLAASLRGILLLALPASVGLMLLRVPLVTFLLERGAFTHESTLMTSWALLWYSAGLVGHCLVEILSRAFFALHDTRTPVAVTSVAMLLNILMSIGFTLLFQQAGWLALGGLALANSLATALESLALLFFLRRRLGGIEGRRIWQVLWRGGFATLVMGAGLWAWISLSGNLAPWLITLLGVVLGGLIYGILMLLLKVDEVGRVISLARARLRI